ncbi:MAG: ATP-binding cassette domain-containing protein [Puniceicoccales bacterium]|jgi:putative ABC transport system ATP-binding protein|nr:ATP-binding cassette domain-containing protein [Puniceicoccales bacterium]
MITLEDIHLTYNPSTAAENHVLNGLNLHMESGEFATLIGGNGAGKTSIMNVLGGFVCPDSGRILIGDEDVTADPAWKRASRVARVFQSTADGICMKLSVEQNMALAYRRGSRPSIFRPAVTRKMRRLIVEKLESLGLGLEKRLGDQMGQLSGGQHQAIGLLMAAMQSSELLLLDEHTSALDPVTADSIMELTSKIVSEKKLTTLMITHSMRQALRYGTRVIMLHRGQIVLDFSGQEKAKLRVSDLLKIFEETSGEEADSALVLN